MNYLVIDLEMCRVPRNYRGKHYKYANEIIQAGAVLLNESYEKIATLSQYVHPEYGVLDHFISNLTGIQNNQIKNAPRLEEAMIHMIHWLGDREYKVLAWSDNDRVQLLHEIKSKNIMNSEILEFMNEDRWMDYQEVFGRRYDFDRAVSLEEALLMCCIEPEGRMHDGLDDAVNTAQLIARLEMNSEFQLAYREAETDDRPLNTCLGDLFSGLNIQFA